MHIRKRPSGKYQCIIHLNGISTSKTFRDKKSCQIWGREQESLIDCGMYRRVPDRLTLRQIIQLYIEKCVPLLKTQKSVTDQLNRLCKNYSWLVDMQYKNIKPIHFEELVHYVYQYINLITGKNCILHMILDMSHSMLFNLKII